ncbi:MAG: hypothetical protein HY063_07210 [Bacteroidetes bacterium]|nr:hypothetical protein [Bacteroidota bacterium]
MKPLKKTCTFLLLLLFFLMEGDGICQLAIGQWRNHLSYKAGISITQSNDLIYCASESGVFQLEKNRYELNTLSKVSGLSDVDVSALRYNFFDNTLLIAYKNANIDLVQGKNIYNISDIKRKLITAKKIINNIYFINGLAYLACGFGIVVVDLDKKEIGDSYYIGQNSGYINVHDITSDANYIYAATDSGVYRASWNSSNLADYNSWQKFSLLPKGMYNTIVSFAGKIIANNHPYSCNIYGCDTLYVYDGTQWTHFLKLDTSFFPVRKLETGANKLLIPYPGATDIFDLNFNWLGRINSYTTGLNLDPFQAIIDNNVSDVTWIADHNYGIVKNYQIWSGTNYFFPNGPNKSQVYAMQISNGDLWTAPGSRNDLWVGSSHFAEAYKFSSENWSSTTGTSGIGTTVIAALDTMRDIVSVAIDPVDKEHVYLGTLGQGIVEIKNGALVNLWNESNTGASGLQSRGDATFHWVGIFGMTFDQNNNLWITNCYATNPLVVRKATDGTWQNFNFSPSATTPTIGQIIVTKNNQKWMVLPRSGGMLVFNDNGTWGTGDDNKIHLSFPSCVNNISGNNSDIPTDALCLAEDNDGEIWVGTDKGIMVFYCADQIFSSTGCKAQQIFIQQDTHTQLLLETEEVTAIAVDGANRKWIGTQNSGVYLMSADGTQQINHFTADNSPLLSNEITSIVIHPKTGEVFFGTSEGIISYRSDATQGLEDFTDVYVFPNPVRPDYEGPIAITGLIENAVVKITDITGMLVYQTKALGGQAIWYGKNFKGENARSGVYMVFCSNDDGSKTYVAKILKVN